MPREFDNEPVRREILAFIKSHIAEHGLPPTKAAVAAAVGRSDTSIIRHLRAMDRAGTIIFRPGHRAIALPAPEVKQPPLDPDGEVVLELASGWSLRSGGEEFTSGEYVRLCKPDGSEHLQWHQDEWRDDPALVMGAIINAAITAPEAS